MTTIFSFGSGSCGNSYYISNDNDAIIIDAGIGIRRYKRIIRERGIQMGKVRAMLVTHDHADHVKCVGLVSSEYNIPVYAQQNVHNGILRNRMIKHKIPERNIRILDINCSTVLEERDDNAIATTIGEPFTIGSFTVTAFALPHDASANTGYCIESEGKTVVIMTDVGSITSNVHTFIKRSNALIIESNYDLDMLRVGRYPEILKERIASGYGHLSNAQTAEALAATWHPELKTILLCHLSEENNTPSTAAKTTAEALQAKGIDTVNNVRIKTLHRRLVSGPFEI